MYFNRKSNNVIGFAAGDNGKFDLDSEIKNILTNKKKRKRVKKKNGNKNGMIQRILFQSLMSTNSGLVKFQ